jgi:hypothetical protein
MNSGRVRIDIMNAPTSSVLNWLSSLRAWSREHRHGEVGGIEKQRSPSARIDGPRLRPSLEDRSEKVISLDY